MESQVGVEFNQYPYPMTQTILPASERRLQARRRRTNMMMMSMLAGFVISWLPMNVMNVARDLQLDGVIFGQYYQFLFALSHVAAMMSTVCNPIVYCWFNEAFRNTLLILWPCLKPV
jgi:hypothetical protein